MKKNLTLVGLLTLGLFAVQAQTTVAKAELNETFEDGYTSSISSGNNTIEALFTSEANGELELVAEGGPYFDLYWTSPDLSTIDSLIIEFKMDSKLYGDSKGNWNSTPSNELILFSGTNYELNFSLYTAANTGVYFDGATSYNTYNQISEENGYLFLKKKIVGTFDEGERIEILSILENEELETEYTLYTNDELIIAQSTNINTLFTDFCTQLYTLNGTNIDSCIIALGKTEPVTNNIDAVYIDDLKITSYSTVTAIEDLVYNNKVVSAVFNTMGHEVALDTKNETLIVKYTDGSSERIFNVR